MLKNAGVAPPWIEADKEVRRLLEQRDAILGRAGSGQKMTSFQRRRDRGALEDLVRRINEAIARVNAESPNAVQHRRALVIADELAKYDEASAGSLTTDS